MALHYLNPEREPRDCPCASVPRYLGSDDRLHCAAHPDCRDCHGIGRLGVEGAEPDVRIVFFPDNSLGDRGWHYCHEPYLKVQDWHGPYPTEAAALEAARKAHGRGE